MAVNNLDSVYSSIQSSWNHFSIFLSETIFINSGSNLNGIVSLSSSGRFIISFELFNFVLLIAKLRTKNLKTIAIGMIIKHLTNDQTIVIGKQIGHKKQEVIVKANNVLSVLYFTAQ